MKSSTLFTFSEKLSYSVTALMLLSCLMSLLVGFLDGAQPLHLVPVQSGRTLLDDPRPSGGAVCSGNAQCGGEGQGTCVIPEGETAGTCQCAEAFGSENCTYERKRKLTAFLLALLVGGWGASRFYLGYIALGIVQILLTLINCCSSGAFRAVGAMKKEGEDAKPMWMIPFCGGVCCVALAVVIWWLVDCNGLPDVRGYALWNNM